MHARHALCPSMLEISSLIEWVSTASGAGTATKPSLSIAAGVQCASMFLPKMNSKTAGSAAGVVVGRGCMNMHEFIECIALIK